MGEGCLSTGTWTPVWGDQVEPSPSDPSSTAYGYEPSTGYGSGYEPSTAYAYDSQRSEPSTAYFYGSQPSQPSTGYGSGYEPSEPSTGYGSGYEPSEPSTGYGSGYEPSEPSTAYVKGQPSPPTGTWAPAWPDEVDPPPTLHDPAGTGTDSEPVKVVFPSRLLPVITAGTLAVLLVEAAMYHLQPELVRGMNDIAAIPLALVGLVLAVWTLIRSI
jgi:hypothetical protein